MSMPYVWRTIREPYQAGDRHECIRVLRGVVDARPFEIVPRMLLAGLCLEAGNARLAQLHYEKLLPLAVGLGDLFRALAIQRRMDELHGGDLPSGRYVAMQRWFRLVGLPTSFRHAEGSIAPAALLALPQAAFERLALGIVVERFEPEPRRVTTQAGATWVVLYGTLRWSIQRPGENGAGRVEESSEGSLIRVDPDLYEQAELEFEAPLPVECLRFGPEVLRELGRVAPALGLAPTTMASEFVSEVRVSPPTAPRRAEDFDHAAPAPLDATATEPPRLHVDGAAVPPTHEPIESWSDLDQIELPADGPPPAVPLAEDICDPLASRAGEPVLDLSPGADDGKSRPRGRPMVEPPRPVELDGGLIIPPVPDPFAPKMLVGEPVERRAVVRVEVALASRIALIGVGTQRGSAIAGEVRDLSPRGMGMRFRGEDLRRTLVNFESAAIRVELALPDPGRPLVIAGRVHSVEFAADGHEARIGVEFLLVTAGDRLTLEAATRRGLRAA